MAKKHFLLPEPLVRKVPFLRVPGWMLEAAVLRSLVRLLRLFSPEKAEHISRKTFRTIAPILPFASKIRTNLQLAFPEYTRDQIETVTASISENLGAAAADLIFAGKIWSERDRRIEVVLEDGVNLDHYRDHPAVMVTGHIGAWQIAPFIAPMSGMAITSVYAPEENPWLRTFMFNLRRSMQTRFISRDGCMKHLVRELRSGGIVGLVSDTKMPDGETVSFFGRSTLANTSPARLALRHECDLLPVRAERLPGMRYRITVCSAIRPDREDVPLNEQAREMTQKLFGIFESWIRDDPEEWICFSRRWPKAQAGAPE